MFELLYYYDSATAKCNTAWHGEIQYYTKLTSKMKSKKRQQTTKRSTIKQQIAPANDEKKHWKWRQEAPVNDKTKTPANDEKKQETMNQKHKQTTKRSISKWEPKIPAKTKDAPGNNEPKTPQRTKRSTNKRWQEAPVSDEPKVRARKEAPTRTAKGNITKKTSKKKQKKTYLYTDISICVTNNFFIFKKKLRRFLKIEILIFADYNDLTFPMYIY